MEREVANRAEGDVDRVVQQRFFPDTGAHGVFVDVGAASPDYLSTSAHFRALGWRIIAVEPNPAFCEMHRARGHEVLQYACGERDEDNVEFLVVDSHGAEYAEGRVSYESFSSLGIKGSYSALKQGLDINRIRVNLRRLDTILRTHAPDVNRIDVLSIDVEGWEVEVLKGLDIPRYRPRVMIIENLFDDPEYRAYAQEFGYVLWKRVPPNEVYVSGDLLPGWSRWWSRWFYPLFAPRSK